MTSSNPAIFNPFVSDCAYRSLLDDPDLAADFDMLEFGRGTRTVFYGSGPAGEVASFDAVRQTAG